eukprot:jgi/Botrbrau1/4766/Bobra.0137s0038.1
MDRPTNQRPKRQRRSAGSAVQEEPVSNRAQYHCNYCSRDISNVVRIKCAVCTDFDLCVDCFRAGGREPQAEPSPRLPRLQSCGQPVLPALPS